MNEIVNNNNKIQKNKTVVDRVINIITNRIISGEYKPNMKIPNEYDLIYELDVSRNSLREAIKILTAMGILEIRRGDGTYVCSKMSPTVFDTAIYSIISGLSSNTELLELRQVLDEATVRLAIDKATKRDIQKLESNVENMEKLVLSKNYNQAQEYDFQFHMMLIDCCKNKFFDRILKGVYGIFQSSIGNTLRLENIDSKAPKYHREIVECIKNKDYHNVNIVVRNSLISWRKMI